MRRQIHTFDRVVDGWIRSLPKWLHLPMVVLTALGQPICTCGLAALMIGIGYGHDNPQLRLAAAFAVATLVTASLLKFVLRRHRPLTEYVERMFFHTFSFPSGHAAGTVPIYGLAAYLLAQLAVYGVALATVITIIIVLIGVSRVYLGAHYASDVVGGWLVGLTGLAVIIFIIQPSL